MTYKDLVWNLKAIQGIHPEYNAKDVRDLTLGVSNPIAQKRIIGLLSRYIDTNQTE